ncbi:hypothetical protein SEA_LIMPID_154 [Streptomyces phage Limpid]|uniref:Uncharacterized protein n=1 Tax=Streptomyces phage Limpid TaxID=2653770 RepID=A0A5Q2WLS7_9CAUD|nr:hypothetical protein SEA_LIMPID_154 [Streptomyces phage Limpid]
MQFTQVDEDAYSVLMNLDTIKRIGDGLAGDERDEVLKTSFANAHERLTRLNTLDETVEVSDTPSE